jgi:hypothetical protein
MSNYVIETQALSVFYGPYRDILDLDLQIEQGKSPFKFT